MYGASASREVDLGLIPSRVNPVMVKLVFTAYRLDSKHQRQRWNWAELVQSEPYPNPTK